MHGIKKFAVSAALVALSVVGLAACGGENSTPVSALPTATLVEAATPTTAAITEAPTATSDTGSTARATPTTGSGGTGSSEALDVLRESAAAMKDIKSYHIVLESSAGGQSTTAEGDIEVPDKTRLVVDTPQGETEVLIIGDKAYTLLPGTDQYLETDSGLMGGQPDTNPAGFAQVAQEAEVVGDEQVDGADTTHVKFTFDLQAAAAASSQASGQPTPEGLGDLANADAWIEKGTGFMRKLSYTAEIQGTETSTTMTLSKFNETVDPPIEVPANVTTPGDMFGGTPTP
jgi:outer membrane lipoprotein-sorting protein